MTFIYAKIQSCELFISNEVIFHPAVRIKADDFYQAYYNFLEKTGLIQYAVEKHVLWSLVKAVVSEDVLGFLAKKTSRDLYYIGIGLRVDAIPQEIMSNVLQLGIQGLSHSNFLPLNSYSALKINTISTFNDKKVETEENFKQETFASKKAISDKKTFA